jgi:hypothetical protein
MRRHRVFQPRQLEAYPTLCLRLVAVGTRRYFQVHSNLFVRRSTAASRRRCLGPIGFLRIGKLVGAVTIMVPDPFHGEAQVVFVAALGHQVKDPVGAHE